MHGTTSIGKCVLCDGAVQGVTSQGNERVLYTCTTDSCGTYACSSLTRNRVAQRFADDRKSMSERAYEAKARGEWLCIWVDPHTDEIRIEIALKWPSNLA